jgi:UDP-N-acetylmuramate: L-alanyl-gamma-D-glutamyl-meso-diaminopimelate ligase
LIYALAEADASVIAAVANPEKVAADQRLNTAKVAASVTARGKPCWFEVSTDAIVSRLKSESRSGDVIVVFSNGGFDGIHDKLLKSL